MSDTAGTNAPRRQSVSSVSQTHPDPFCELCCPVEVQKWDQKITNRKWSHSEKVVLLTAILVFASIATALAIRFHLLHPRTLLLGAGDQRPVSSGHGDFSAKFCSEYELDLGAAPENAGGATGHLSTNQTKPQINAYLSLESPSRSKKPLNYRRQYDLELNSSDYQYWAYYMDVDAQLQVELLCYPSSDIVMHIFKGEERFYDWIEKAKYWWFSGTYSSHIFTCQGSEPVTEKYTFQIPANKVDEYVFIFQRYSPTDNAVSTNVTFTMHRDYLELENIHDHCHGVQHCKLSVPNKADTVMLEMMANSSTSTVAITTRCLPKIGMYFAFFFAVPLAIWLAIAGIVFLLWTCHRQVLMDVQNADNARAMSRLHNQPSPRYTAGTEPNREMNDVAGTASRPFRPFRTNPASYRIPLVRHDVLSTTTENETASRSVSRSLPSYDAVAPRPNSYPDGESRLELFGTTPPPDYDPNMRHTELVT